MDIQTLTNGISNPAVLIPQIYQEWKSYYEWQAYLQYDPKSHKVNDRAFRRDKVIQVPDPFDTSDDPKNITQIVPVWRLPIPMQQFITLSKTAFTTGGRVKYKSQPSGSAQENIFQRVQDILKKEKTDPYKNSEIVKTLLSQTEVAMIWYSEKDADNDLDKTRLKCNIYKPSDGNDLVPVFDGNNDLIAFGRAFKNKVDGKLSNNLHLYTVDYLYKYVKEKGNDWVLSGQPIKLPYGKIPVIYFSVNQSCWQIVQPLIERIEFLLSNHADENDRTGSPILFAEGDIQGWSAAGESGKVIEGKNGAKLSYVEHKGAPESIKMEWENLMELIFTLTQSVNLSTEKMSELTNASGEAFERLMMNAHLGAMDLQNGEYGKGIQRCINFLVSACANIFNDCEGGGDLEITPEFGLFRLDNTATNIDNAMKANGGRPVLDDEASIAMAGLSDNPKATLEKIKAQTKS